MLRKMEVQTLPTKDMVSSAFLTFPAAGTPPLPFDLLTNPSRRAQKPCVQLRCRAHIQVLPPNLAQIRLLNHPHCPRILLQARQTHNSRPTNPLPPFNAGVLHHPQGIPPPVPKHTLLPSLRPRRLPQSLLPRPPAQERRPRAVRRMHASCREIEDIHWPRRHSFIRHPAPAQARLALSEILHHARSRAALHRRCHHHGAQRAIEKFESAVVALDQESRNQAGAGEFLL